VAVLAAALLVLALPPRVRGAETGHEANHPPAPAITAEAALARLLAGNARFADGKPQHDHQSKDWRARLEQAQHPMAVILGCADSRVPPELLFDQGFGDLFVVRVAGNIVDTDVTASIEYAVDHLGTPLVVVLGHSRCGAVTAALDHLSDSDVGPDEIASLFYRIEPALIGLPRDKNREEQLGEAVKRNVALGVRRLSRVPDLMKSLKKGKVKIVGAVYDIHSGKVDLLKP
jgi:carbonic anhydrase